MNASRIYVSTIHHSVYRARLLPAVQVQAAKWQLLWVMDYRSLRDGNAYARLATRNGDMCIGDIVQMLCVSRGCRGDQAAPGAGADPSIRPCLQQFYKKLLPKNRCRELLNDNWSKKVCSIIVLYFQLPNILNYARGKLLSLPRSSKCMFSLQT